MIGPDTKVYPWVYHPPISGQRVWIASYETVRNKVGDLVIDPKLDDDPRAAMGLPYQAALIIKRRLESEQVISPLYEIHFSLNPTGDEVAGGNRTAAPNDDNRTVMMYRGLLVRPGVSVNHGRVWYVKFPNSSIESIRGNTVEEAVDLVYDRGLQDKAEQAPPAPPPVPEPSTTPKKNYGARIRPGDLYTKGD
jgi:hypothetical protein